MKVISIKEDVYNKLKEKKEGRSFSVLLGELIGLYGEDARNVVKNHEARIKRLEEFVIKKSGGQYESE